MSEISKSGAGASDVQRPPTLEQLAEFVDKPLRQLPADWRAPVWDFWCFWSHLLPTQLALVTRLRQWHATGLALEHMLRAFQKLNRPERAADFRFAGDLLAALAEEVAPPPKDFRERLAELEARHDADMAAERARKAGGA